MNRLKKLSTSSGPALGVRVIFLSTEKKRPYVNLPIVLAGEQPLNSPDQTPRFFLNIQAKLATNGNGYVSFKVRRDQVQRFREIYVYPLGHEDLKVPMRDFINNTNGEGIETVELSCDVASKIKRENIPAIQKADLIDHDFIPFLHRISYRNTCHTFEANTQSSTGATADGTTANGTTADASSATTDSSPNQPCGCHDQQFSGDEPQAVNCEALLPDTQPVECMTIYQLDKDNSSTNNAQNGDNTLAVQEGSMNIFESCFEPYGYSLGDLNYSVSLAPCESVNIAVENWSRRDRTTRSESTSRAESLENDIVRSKSVQEFIKSKLTEHKFNVGLSSTFMIKGIPISASLGYGFGSRKSTTEMVQDINETHRQLANSYSSYNSVAVYETTQSEARNTTTRNLRNHNHCHTLTFMYYEIVQNIKLITEEQGTRDALFIKYPTPCFTLKDVIAKRHILRDVLLDQALVECLDGICMEDYSCDCSSPVSTGDDGGGSTPTDPVCPATATKLHVSVTIADKTWAGSEGNLYLLLNIGGSIQSFYISHAPDGKYKKNKTYTVEISIPPTCVTDITQVGLELIGTNKIILSNLAIDYECQEDPGTPYFLFNQGLNNLELDNSKQMLNRAVSPETPNIQPPNDDTPPAIQAAQDAADCCESNLLQHLNCNKLYYYKIFWMLEDENERAVRLEPYTYLGQPLLDQMENTPVGVIGDWVAFPATASMVPATNPVVEETFLYAPTGNVFSEAVLGRCGSCEVQDNSVYWDWSDSPCSGNAPAITTGGLSQYQAAALNPFAFANPLLGMQALSNLSASASLGSIAQAALGQSITAFPDMSEKMVDSLLKFMQESKDNGSSDPDYQAAVDDLIEKLGDLKSIYEAIDKIGGDN